MFQGVQMMPATALKLGPGIDRRSRISASVNIPDNRLIVLGDPREKCYLVSEQKARVVVSRQHGQRFTRIGGASYILGQALLKGAYPVFLDTPNGST